jgi:hypothetical protein
MRAVGRSAGVSPALKRAAVIALYPRDEGAQTLAHRLGICRPTLYHRENERRGADVGNESKPC